MFEGYFRNMDRLTRRVIKISWPMIIGELCDSIYSIVDTYFVSGLGTTALAGVGLAGYIVWLSFVVATLFTTGVIVYVSQCYGAGEYDRARRAIGETIAYGFLVGLGVGLLLSRNSTLVVSLLTSSKGVVYTGSKYFSIRIMCLPVAIIAWSLDSSLRAIGAVRESMIALVSSALLNVFLDPILIYGYKWVPGLGVAGAALATVIATSYLIPVELFFLYRKGFMPETQLKPRYLWRVVRIGSPTAIERAVFTLGSNIYISLVARCGETALAAHNIGIRIESFIYMPGFAFMIAASTLVGQEIGRGDLESGRRIGWETARVAVTAMGLLGVLVALTSYYIVAPFSPTEDVRRLASIYLILAGLSESGLALSMVISGAIRGAGNTVIPMIVNVCSVYLSRILPALILIDYYGIVGVWIGMFIDVYIRGICLSYIYTRFFTKIVKRIV